MGVRVRATVRRFHSPDENLASYWPDDDKDFGLLLQILVGPADGPGEESFDVMYCSPSWLARHIDRVGLVVGRHHLFANSYDWPAAKAFLTGRVEAESADSWPEIASRLGRIGMWEFEDYAG